MRGRYQIVVSSPRRSDSPASPAPGGWPRLKATLVAIGMLVAVGGLLTASLIVGSILAAVLLVAVALMIGAAAVRRSWRRIGRNGH